MKLRIGLILLSSFSIIIGITIKTKLEAHFNKTISINQVEDLKNKLNVNFDVDKNEISKINLISF